MRKINIYQFLIILFGLSLLAGCEDVIKEESFSVLTDDNFYENQTHAIIAVNGVYRAMTDRNKDNTQNSTYGMDGNLLMMNKLSDVNYNDGAKANYGGPIAIATLSENDVVTSNVWALSYMLINRANNVIGNLPDVPMDSVLQQRIVGEAKFLRAFAYFNLVKYWGRVPIHTDETRDFEDATILKGRNSVEEVYGQIISDLEFAEQSLYFKYNSFDENLTYWELPPEAIGRIIEQDEDGISYMRKVLEITDKGRATVGAARSMLGRVYLYLASAKRYGQLDGYEWVDDFTAYQRARDYCGKVIDYGHYSLLDNYQSLFSTSNKYHNESIFEIGHDDTSEDQGSIFGYWHSGSTRIAARPEYVKLFDATFDTDADLFVDSLTDARLYHSASLHQNKDKIMITKYGMKSDFKFPRGWPEHLKFINWIGSGFNGPVNVPVIRYADVLLMMAESVNEIEGPGRAYEYINQVRARARRSNVYPTNYPADLFGLTQADFRSQVWDERKRELSFELHSLSDLVRTGTFMEKIQATKYLSQSQDVFDDEKWANATSSVLAGNVSEYNMLFPVPLRERDLNPNLDQNPGYNGSAN